MLYSNCTYKEEEEEKKEKGGLLESISGWGPAAAEADTGEESTKCAKHNMKGRKLDSYQQKLYIFFNIWTVSHILKFRQQKNRSSLIPFPWTWYGLGVAAYRFSGRGSLISRCFSFERELLHVCVLW